MQFVDRNEYNFRFWCHTPCEIWMAVDWFKQHLFGGMRSSIYEF